MDQEWTIGGMSSDSMAEGMLCGCNHSMSGSEQSTLTSNRLLT